MTVRKADNSVLSKAALVAASTDVTPTAEKQYTMPYDVFQSYKTSPKDGGSFESQTKKIFHAGQTVKQSELDAVFAAATVSTVSPATGGIAGGTAVTITGTNLAGTTGVTFGGTAATNVKVVSESKVTCTAPAHAAGAVNVVVADDSGNVTKTNGFTYA